MKNLWFLRQCMKLANCFVKWKNSICCFCKPDFLNALLIITMGSPKGFPRMGLEKKWAKKCQEVDRKKNKCHHRWNFVSHFSWFLTIFVQFYGLRRPYMASNECPIDDILSPYNVAPMTGFHSILDALHDLRKPPHLLSGKCSLWKKGVIYDFFRWARELLPETSLCKSKAVILSFW